MYKILLSFLTVAIALSSCTESKNQDKIGTDGIWEQLGYGKIFEIKNDSVKIYDICKMGCNVFEHVPLKSKGEISSFSEDSLLLRKNIKTYKFVRLPSLPSLCSQNQVDSNDPIFNFEVLWNTFNEQYCSFDKRKIDWTKTYSSYRSKISKETNELELFKLFDEMLNSLNDGHVNIEAPESLIDTLNTLKDEEKSTLAEKPKVDAFELGDMIADKYCTSIKNHNSGIVKWGMMKNNIAYLQINAMWLLAYYKLPTNLALQEFVPLYLEQMDKRVFQRQDEIDGADLLMDTIAMDIQNANALIIDLRFNQGGKDEVSLEFLGHLVDHRIEIASKKAKLGDGYTNHQKIYLEAKKPYFDKDVYVLTSHITASAAEVAVLATLPQKKFLRIGSATEGIFSDGLDKRLPNGWEYVLSNEVYLAFEGKDYEGIGVPPDINLNYPKEKGAIINLILEQLQSTGDEAIETVFNIQQQKLQ